MRLRAIQILFGIGVVVGSVQLARWIVQSPEMGTAILAGIIPTLLGVWIAHHEKSDNRFLVRLFVAALGLRWVVGAFIYAYHLQTFFGADAETYDAFGNVLAQSWMGRVDPNSPWLKALTDYSKSGWGIYYYVASVYYVVGQNPFAVQLINCAIGAGCAIVVYRIAQLLHPEPRVARAAALLTAFSPSMILWSCQGLRDGPIVFCLCLSTYYALRLREKFTFGHLALLLISLFCLFALRHYVAYIFSVAIAGMFVLVPERLSPMKLAQGAILVIAIGLGWAYFGAGTVVERALNLERIQAGREWSAKVSGSGFGGDVDITDPEAALGFLPIGITYVLLAPFPWMITNLRQLVTLPELIVWWALVPTLIRGFWFAVRKRLGQSFSMCLFTVALTLGYALYQTNVGTAYRHRAQLYVFFFIFISLGLELRRKEKAEVRARSMVGVRQWAVNTEVGVGSRQ